MNLSNVSKLQSLIYERQRLAGVVDEIRHGAEVEISVGGWEIGFDDDQREAMTRRAEAEATAELERVEADIAALGVEVDVPRARYVTFANHDCDCEECRAAASETEDDEDQVEEAAA